MPADDRPIHSDATRATAHLPGLNIEIEHRRSPGGDAEQISIHLQAVPSFGAFGRLLESANPFAFWARATQMMWAPWLHLGTLAPPGRPDRRLANRGARAPTRETE
jgi:hypothetical protein